MSLGVLIVEAGKRSGALISARLANEYNREAFALPGLLTNPYAFGTNALIRDGSAKLVTCLDDILDELGDVGKLIRGEAAPATTDRERTPLAKLDDAERAVMGSIGHEPSPLEAICESSGLSPAAVASALTRLQMKRLIVQLPGNSFKRRPTG